MKNVLTGFAAGVLLLLAIAYLIKPGWLCNSSAGDRKPILSLADLAMEASGENGNDLKTLVTLDKQFYMALLQGDQLSKTYFYSRHGSCCPCSYGGTKCCMCPPRSGIGTVANSTEQAYVTSGEAKINLDKNEQGGVQIFRIPESLKAGNYTAVFKGKINIELDITINADRSFNVMTVR